MMRNTEQFMSLFRSKRPVICKVHGFAVAGGSDIALCSDIVVMAEDARIGYMPVRVWGCPTTAMWLYRLGPEKAKRMLFTGDKIDGREAEKLGLVLKAVPAANLDEEVDALAHRIASVPPSARCSFMVSARASAENIDDDELARWRIAGRVMLEGNADWIEAAIADGQLREVQP